ncbi:hypothetical protein GGR21_002213 [Dysgonomonas hofstadii]|uniref:DUF1460 domain-containing protein n=1 Tax=Dysgonomonas hofstadii TaxID=637886 RepID=A0A840CMH2_9BACT|nr:N-acetylmuramoyl-L-alanine amidase-like domain-containing protein [Dysgonomonas hofstadii]MBB4036311.1 hypothetical protein [Dysgonomonas hofstadii]
MGSAKVYILIITGLLCSFQVKSIEILWNKQDSLVYEDYIKRFSDQKDKPYEELIINTARFFLNKPYIASTLEISDDSKIVINLNEFDCTTFVEACIALSKVIKSGDYSQENLSRTFSNIRYRNGKADGYTSRLHYTTDWIYENGQKGVLKDITLKLGGSNIHKEINFMSSKPDLYTHLKNSPENIEEIKTVEKTINSRNSYNIISVTSIANNQKGIRNGDIIAFATAIKGLDYSHIGIAYWQGEKLHFIHASSRMKKIIIESRTLIDYCQSSKNCTGISILRIND